MDATDIKILRALSQNARQKASAISREVGLSVSAVIERIHKLEDSGVIAGYTTVLDQKRLGHSIAAWVEVRLEHPQHQENFAAQIQNIENILTGHYLTGEFDYILHVAAQSPEALEAIHRQIKRIEGVCAIRTHIVLKEVKHNTCLLPELE